MPLRSLLGRILTSLVLIALCLILAAFGAIRIQQRIIRHEAEHLLADIRSVDLRHTSFLELQPMLDRWRSNSHYEHPCTQDRCDVTIAIPDYVLSTREGVAPLREWVFNAEIIARSHPAVVTATISVRKAVVWGKSFAVNIHVEPCHCGSDAYSNSSYELLGLAETVSRFDLGPFRLEDHPNYEVGRPGGCEVCRMVWAKFTPYADPLDVSRLMQFNLDCITRWKLCRSQSDIMPVVWAQVERQEQIPYQPPDCGVPKAIEIAARDAENAAVVQIVRSEKKNESDRSLRITALLQKHLKGPAVWNVDAQQTFWAPVEYITAKSADPGMVRPGDRWILLFDVLLGNPDTHQCGLVPLNDVNLAAVREGVSQDYLAGQDEQP